MIRMIIIYMSGQQSTKRSYSYRISLISPPRTNIFSQSNYVRSKRGRELIKGAPYLFISAVSICYGACAFNFNCKTDIYQGNTVVFFPTDTGRMIEFSLRFSRYRIP